MATHFDNNVQMSGAALNAHVNNLRSSIPPPFQSICFPESLSTFLRNTILAIAVLDILLFLAAFFTWSSRYLGSTTMMVSFVSLLHIAYIAILLGNHLVQGIPQHHIEPNGVLDQLQQLSQRTTSVFAHGTAFGSTALMALLMHVVWAYYARVNDCVVNLDTRLEHAYNITKRHHPYQHTPSYAAIDNVNHLICGAYGPVGVVSFLSGLLYWLNLSLAIALYVKRTELSGAGGGHVPLHSEYEEIHNDLNLREEEVHGNGGMIGSARVLQV